MVKSNQNDKEITKRLTKLASISRISADIISGLYKPIDAINRFLNLSLHSLEEESESREFLLESKAGLRKMFVLLDTLNDHAKEIEQEINEISKNNH